MVPIVCLQNLLSQPTSPSITNHPTIEPFPILIFNIQSWPDASLGVVHHRSHTHGLHRQQNNMEVRREQQRRASMAMREERQDVMGDLNNSISALKSISTPSIAGSATSNSTPSSSIRKSVSMNVGGAVAGGRKFSITPQKSSSDVKSRSSSIKKVAISDPSDEDMVGSPGSIVPAGAPLHDSFAVGGALHSNFGFVSESQAIEYINDITTKLNIVTKERGDLMEEKKSFFGRIQTDNLKLAVTLKSVKDAKKQLIAEMDNVQIEREALKAQQMFNMDSETYKVLSMLNSDECPLGEMGRSLLPSQTKQNNAKELHASLKDTVNTFIANQLDVHKVVERVLGDCLTAFVEGNDDSLEENINALKGIASAKPGNQLAALEVVKGVSDSMVGAMLEKTPTELETKIENSEAFKEKEEKDDDDKLSNEDVVASLTSANDQLKAQLAQMRKKYTILLEKATSKANQAPPVSDHVKSNDNTTKPKLSHGHAIPHGSVSASSSPRPQHGASTSTPVHIPISHSTAGSSSYVPPFETLAAGLQSKAQNMLESQVRRTVNAHSLTKNIQNKNLISEAVAEISSQLRGLLGLSLVAYQDKGLLDLDENSIADAVIKALQSPMIQNELISQTHVVLAYIYSRSGKIDNIATTSNTAHNNHDVSSHSSSSPLDPANESKGNEATPVGKHGHSKNNHKNKHPNTGSSTPGKNNAEGNFNKGVNNNSNSNIFLASSGEEYVQTLRPPEKEDAEIEKNKKVPKFMQPVPKKVRK